jgi:ribonuclease HI
MGWMGRLMSSKGTFFPEPPEADLADLDGCQYMDDIKFPPITFYEIERAIRHAPGNKAPGPDGIPNHILHRVMDIIAPALHVLFNGCLTTGYYPKAFKHSCTVALRKPGKDDYTLPKSYRPIALLNTIGKILDAIIARRISFAVEMHGLLPGEHMGGRRGRSTEHAIHVLLERIYTAWYATRTDVASLLLLDVSGAFDNVSHPRLIHNLRKRRVDSQTVRLIGSFLTDRTTTLRLGSDTSARFKTKTGIPQGSPLSPILYLFYNADLLEIGSRPDLNMCTSGYIDDVAILVSSRTTEENCRRLKQVHAECEAWARKHASMFALSKYTLLHLTKKPKDFDLNQELELGEGRTIKPTRQAKYLGFTLDTSLLWNSHLESLRVKAHNSLKMLSRITGSTWGMSLLNLRKVYQAVILPQVLYGCSAWYVPAGEASHRKKVVDWIKSIQYKGLKMVAGAFKATSTAALEIECYIKPIPQQLDKHLLDAAMRIQTSPLYQYIQKVRVPRRRRIAHLPWEKANWTWSPLEKVEHYLRARIGQEPEQQLEPKQPYITAPWWKPPTVHIALDKKRGKEEHESVVSRSRPSALVLYTDGSCINDKVGASAVTADGSIIHRSYLGRASEATVYAAELRGILSALQIAYKKDHKAVIVFTDNQAAIRSVSNPDSQSGQYILLQIVWMIENLRSKGIEPEFHWVPAHIGIEGNERADKAAKEATGWRRIRDRGRSREVDTDQTAYKPPGYSLVAAMRAVHNSLLLVEWKEAWMNEKTGRELNRICPEPTTKVLLLQKSVPRPFSSLIVQMRTAKIDLRQFLSLRKVPDVDDDKCECGRGSQTVRHVLFSCPVYYELRQETWGRERKRDQQDLRKVLGAPAPALKAAKFMRNTGLLGQFEAIPQTL